MRKRPTSGAPSWWRAQPRSPCRSSRPARRRRSRPSCSLLPRFEKFLDEIAREYELVVLDCPPLLPVGDTLSIVPRVEGVILCVRLGQTTRDQAVAAKDALRRLPERPVGLVLTDSKPGSEYDYSGYTRPRREEAEAPA